MMINTDKDINEARSALAKAYSEIVNSLAIIDNLEADDRAMLPKDIVTDLHFMAQISYEAAYVHNVEGSK